MSHFKTLLFVFLAGVNFGFFAQAQLRPTQPGDELNSSTQQSTPEILPATSLTPEQIALAAAEAEKKRLEEEQRKVLETEERNKMMQALTSGFSQMGGGSTGNFGGAANPSGGNYQGGSYTSGYVSQRPPSKCSSTLSPLSQNMIKDYNTCAATKSSALAGKRPILINTDEKIGFMMDSEGNIINCFTVTIGSKGVAAAGTTAPESDITETGFFFTQVQNGAKYQTFNPDYERKGISMGISTGKVFHSDHERRATAGCIGIEMAKWHDVFQKNIMGSPSFVWSEKYSYDKDKRICNGPGGRPAGQPSGGANPSSYR